MEQALTLAELAEAAAELLGGDGDGAGRVRPTQRTLRYYAAQRLLDPPLELRGPHSAYYGRRHLLQVVAIKKLQSRGRTLSEIRAMLTGATDESLRELAGVVAASGPAEGADPSWTAPFAAAAGGPAGPAEAPPAPLPRAEAFWRVRPDPARQPPTPSPGGPHGTSPAAALLIGVPVGPVVILLPAARPLDEADATAVADAAQPLLAALAGRGLLAPATNPARQRSTP
jgi:DNA-binding transcriptional MerR regulator